LYTGHSRRKFRKNCGILKLQSRYTECFFIFLPSTAAMEQYFRETKLSEYNPDAILLGN